MCQHLTLKHMYLCRIGLQNCPRRFLLLHLQVTWTVKGGCTGATTVRYGTSSTSLSKVASADTLLFTYGMTVSVHVCSRARLKL